MIYGKYKPEVYTLFDFYALGLQVEFDWEEKSVNLRAKEPYVSVTVMDDLLIIRSIETVEAKQQKK